MKMNSILKKVVMALTGLALVGFLIAHLAGNLLIYKGNCIVDGKEECAFNSYGEALDHNPLLPFAEIALLAIFLIHMWSATRLTLENRAARPITNSERKTAGESTFSSRNMWITGFIVLGFI